MISNQNVSGNEGIGKESFTTVNETCQQTSPEILNIQMDETKVGKFKRAKLPTKFLKAILNHRFNQKLDPLPSAVQQNHRKNQFDEIPVIGTQIFGAVVCSFVFMSITIVFGFTGVTLPSLMDPESEDLVLTKFEASIFSSIANIGAIFGSIISSLVMVWFGQRFTLLIFLPIGMASWIVLRFAYTFWLLVVARIGLGLVNGITAGAANSYVLEFAHSTVRGRLVSAASFSYQLGFLFVYLVGSTSISWRNVGLSCGLTTMVVPFLGMLMLPHSPRWLAISGRIEEAEKALVFFRGSHYNVASEMKEIVQQASVINGKTSVRNQISALGERTTKRTFLILIMLNFASHFTGNFAMATYSVTIFQSANISINSYLSTIIVAITRIVGVGIYCMIADKFGRRYIFMIPQVLSGMCIGIVGLFFYLQLIMDDISTISWLPLISLVFFTLFSCISNPVITVWRELLPNSARALGVGLLFVFFYSSAFSVSFTYQYMVDSIGTHWTFWIYGMNSFFMVFIVAIFIPETQGKTLEEIND